MIKEFTITVKPEEEKDELLIRAKSAAELKKFDIVLSDDIILIRTKKSIDARHGQIKFNLRYKAYIGETPEEEGKNLLPCWKKVGSDNAKQVVIVGSGPAGLFGALKLLEYGIRPIIVERGSETTQRKRDIAEISTAGKLNPNSNYCFGEGGAGTFSDGKIYSRSNKRGNIDRILQIFVQFGADLSILTDAHPHIGTDKLPKIINAIREKIIELGGKFYFNTKCTGFITDKAAKKACVKGITCENTQTNEKLEILGNAVLLAAGHSSSDIYKLVAEVAPNALEAKIFAIGVRVEHPRTLIDSIQYHGQSRGETLPTAEYRVTTQVDDRGVYSFCMCPGGFVVPSATEENSIVINGMSASKRNSAWSNAAIVVETRPEDIPEEFVAMAKEKGCGALAGLYFRTWLESETFKHGENYKAPAQRLTDFLDGTDSETLPQSSYTPGVVPSRLDKWLPPQISERLQSAFFDYNKVMRGYICPDALVIAIETRTSTPVRIVRDKETFECTQIKNLYPAGEGSGYAGGITSSALDGENSCERIAHCI